MDYQAQPEATIAALSQVQIEVHGFLAVLRHSFLPPLTCAMVEISSSGARCRLPAEQSGEFLVSAWENALETGTEAALELAVPGQPLQIRGESCGVEREGEMNFCSLSFCGIDSEHHARIEDVLSYFKARQPGRGNKQPQPEKTSSNTAAPAPAGLLSSMLHSLQQTLHISEEPEEDFHCMRLGEILVTHGRLSKDKMEQACREAQAQHLPLGRYLLKNGLVSSIELARALALQTRLPIVNLHSVGISDEFATHFLAREIMIRYRIVPFNEYDNTLYLACSHALSPSVVKGLQRYSKHRLKLFIALDEDIELFLNHLARRV